MKKQQGMTLISWVIVLAIIAFFATLTMRLVPMYQEYYGVLQIMKSMETELKNNKLSNQQVMLLLSKRFNTGYISSVKKENIELFRGRSNDYVTKVGHFVTEVDVEPEPTNR
jgi:Tfp pilus assembly major pilin PilA